MCDMTHIYVTWLITVGELAELLVYRAPLNKRHIDEVSYVWHDSFISATWLIHLCDMTHSYVWHDSFICVTWLFEQATYRRGLCRYFSVWCHLSICVPSPLYICVAWPRDYITRTHIFRCTKVYLYIYMYIYTYTYWYIYMYMYTRKYWRCLWCHLSAISRFYMYMYTYTRTYWHMYVYIHMYILTRDLCIYVYIHMCILIYICIYTHVQIDEVFVVIYCHLFICVTWFVHGVRHDLYVCVTWLVHMSAVTAWYLSRDSYIHIYMYKSVFIYICIYTRVHMQI